MNNIHLYGHLTDRSAPTHRLSVETAGEAVRALCTREPDLKEEFEKGGYVVLRASFGGRLTSRAMKSALANPDIQLDEETLHLGLGDEDLHFIPVLEGEGGHGTGKLLLGIALVAGAWIAAPAAFGVADAAGGTLTLGGMGSTAFSLGGLAVSYGQVALFGAIMALQGVSQLLTPKKTGTKNSFIFGQPENVNSQGVPVPLVYGGPIRVGSIVVSSGITNYSVSSYGTVNAAGKSGAFAGGSGLYQQDQSYLTNVY